MIMLQYIVKPSQIISKFVFLHIIVLLVGVETQAQDTSFTVMTYNIHHANPPGAADTTINIPAVAEVINQSNPDLVALQEVDVNNRRSGIKRNEAKELADLTGMHYYFTKAIDFEEGAYGDAVLSRFKILDSLRYELPVTIDMKGETRSVCVIKIQFPNKGKFLFASTHLDHLAENRNRILQADVLSDIIRSFNLPLIIAGDFNSTPKSPAMQKLDLVLNRTCTVGCPFTFPFDKPTSTIDYVLYTPGAPFKTLNVRTVEKADASDHLPLLVKMKFQER